jgi:hypothetical protein
VQSLTELHYKAGEGLGDITGHTSSLYVPRTDIHRRIPSIELYWNIQLFIDTSEELSDTFFGIETTGKHIYLRSKLWCVM